MTDEKRTSFGQPNPTLALGKNVNISKMYVSIGDNVSIGTDTVVHQYANIGHNVTIGKGVNIGGGARISDNVTIGDYVEVGSHTHICQNVIIPDYWHIPDSYVVNPGLVLVKK